MRICAKFQHTYALIIEDNHLSLLRIENDISKENWRIFHVRGADSMDGDVRLIKGLLRIDKIVNANRLLTRLNVNKTDRADGVLLPVRGLNVKRGITLNMRGTCFDSLIHYIIPIRYPEFY